MKFNKIIKSALLTVCAVTFMGTASADDEAIDTIRNLLKERFPNVEFNSVNHSSLPGWVEVSAGVRVLYFDNSGKYMLNGSVIDLENSEDLTATATAAARLRVLDKIDEDEMLVYRPKEAKHTVTIVTDIDCGYCRKLHQEMDEYMENNIKVRYLMVHMRNKQTINKSIGVWCSKDKNLTMDIAKAGGAVDEASCDHPFDKHKQIAGELGIRGTPAIVLEDGTLLGGYVPIKDLVKKIELI